MQQQFEDCVCKMYLNCTYALVHVRYLELSVSTVQRRRNLGYLY